MHIRRLSKVAPAPAFDVEQVLFIGNGVLGLLQSTVSLTNTVRTLVKGLMGTAA